MTAPTPLVGEPLAIDLVNTLTAGGDLLDTPDRLGAWLALETDLRPALGRFDADAALLAAALAIRGHTAAAVAALLEGEPPPQSALRSLAAALDAAPGRTCLSWDGHTVTETVEPAGPAPERLAATLARAAIDLLTDPAVAKLRQCGAEDCVLVFLPAHPRRQWCSAEGCGNRVRVARYYERRRAARDAD
ncbi:ABATE domain-containing protein [Glycomyces sp. NRRL B-16210]|uniref:CGNR zinc finger domain-containing protein n=1 Tax=Glycomyces sp. NRRL B-16210 TaxID=1463821 RepID=UPI0004BF6862|nr:CGNR zinc finger domain-containing protein [Glycomyces sp. NRRL B-16210]